MKVRDAILAFRYKEGTFSEGEKQQEGQNEETDWIFSLGFTVGKAKTPGQGQGFREIKCAVRKAPK